MLFDQAQDYAKNMSAGYLSTVIPGLAFVGSVFTFGFGVYPALIVYNASLVLGVFISLAPARKNKAIAGQLPASEGYEILDVPEETA